MLLNDSCLEILINVPLKYPEINAVKFKAEIKILALEFALREKPDAPELNAFYLKMKKAGGLYHQICGSSAAITEVALIQKEEVCFLTVYRDEESLTEGEIDIYINILKEFFDSLLIKDRANIDTKDSYKKQLKKNLMHRIHQGQDYTYLWAFRQGGRVFVLNK